VLAYLLSICMGFAAFWTWVFFAAAPGITTFVPALGVTFITWTLFRAALR
jgi:hypothetical protein